MPQGGKIIVQPGATLIVDGADITNICGEMWAGIEVGGDPTLNQTTSASAQGKVILRNGATIENALDAIKVSDQNWNTGGIVQCSDANFINNQRSVEFLSYHFINRSFFTNCHFKVDNLYRGGTTHSFWEHVSMWDVRGVSFTACSFVNSQPQNLLGRGIFTLDAEFRVNCYCDVLTQQGYPCPQGHATATSFNGFEHGIYAGNSGNNRPFSVDQCFFENNVCGIKANVVDYINIGRNHLNVGGNQSALDYTGIELNVANSYRVEENNIQPFGINATYGIRAINSGASPNEIYKNTIHGMGVANNADRDNSDLTHLSGLQYLCNPHSGNSYDIAVTPFLTNFGIQLIQGNNVNSISAGNFFSQTGSESDIFNHSNFPIIYYYDSPGTLKEPIGYTVGKVFPTLATTAKTCPSKYESDFINLSLDRKNQIRADYVNSESAYLNVFYEYNQLIDGGSTNVLLTEVENSWSQEAWNLRDQLIAKSPYLSESVLRATALEDVLPQAMLLEVCLANPDATRDQNFLDFLQNEISNPLPQYMIDLILASWNIKTYRTTLQGKLSLYNHEMAFASNLLLTDMYFDSTETDHTDSVRYWLDRIQTIHAKYELAENYYQNDNYESALQILNSISSNFQLSERETHEITRYKDYLNFRNTIKNSGRNLMQLSNEEILTLRTLAESSDDIPAVMAQSLLCFGYGVCYETIPPELGGNYRIKPKNRNTTSNSLNNIVVAPNPASTYSVFKYDFPLLKGKALLSITDITGRPITEFAISDRQNQIIWDTRQVEDGIYIFLVKTDNKIIANGKIIIEK